MPETKTMKTAICIFVILAATPCRARTITVDDDAPADFNNIQAAIDDANDGDTVEVQPGTYTGPGNRDIDFLGKAITVTSTDPSNPNIVAQTTIDCNALGRAFYFHNDEDANSVLAGLTLRNGNTEFGGGVYCDRSSPRIDKCTILGNHAAEDGGGIYCSYSSPLITNSILSANSAHWNGGAMYNQSSSPNLIDCTFSGNFGYGGAIYSYRGKPTLTNCRLINNSSSSGGGGMFNNACSVTLVDCVLTGNTARSGGGAIENYTFRGSDPPSFPTFIRCQFIENSTDQYQGGAILNYYSHLTLLQCLFSKNIAKQSGGAIHNHKSHGTFAECLFYDNHTDSDGGAIHTWNEASPIIANCTFVGNKAAKTGGAVASQRSSAPVLTNCILVDNRASIGDAISVIRYVWVRVYTSQIAVSWSNVEGGYDGVYVESECNLSWEYGNIDVDPLFAHPGYWDPNGTPVDANDDFWVQGDCHLKSQAGRYDPNSCTWATDDVSSPCIDAGDPISAIGYEPFPNGGIVNMGAYGGTAEASKSYFGMPLCETIIAGDINGDCKVDAKDFALLARPWFLFNAPYPPGQATEPFPANEAYYNNTSVNLSWKPGDGARSHDIYFGTESPGIFRASQTEITFNPGPLSYGTKYYWRIDEINHYGTTTGVIWTFAAGPTPR
jgi:predicted outer membrane repeat protein